MIIKQLEIIKNEEGFPALEVINKHEFNMDEFEINSIEWIIHMLYNVFNAGILFTEHYYVVVCDQFDVTKGVYLAAIGDSAKVSVEEKHIGTLLALSGAEQFIVVHNHPNKSNKPSEGDKENAFKMKMIGECMGSHFGGSYIITENEWIDVETGKIFQII